MSDFFKNLFVTDPMFREFVRSQGKSLEDSSDQEKNILLRQYYAVPFKEYYRRRMMFLAGKEDAVEDREPGVVAMEC